MSLTTTRLAPSSCSSRRRSRNRKPADHEDPRVFSSGDVVLIRSLPLTHRAAHAGFTVHPAASQLAVFSARVGIAKAKMPDGINPPGIQFWRRPTLARPVVALPSGLQRFTSVFGMGTGGTTALGSPEGRADCRFGVSGDHFRFAFPLRGSRTFVGFRVLSKIRCFPPIL